jgi:hypothetical protein
MAVLTSIVAVYITTLMVADSMVLNVNPTGQKLIDKYVIQRKRSWPNLRFSTGILLEGMRKP